MLELILPVISILLMLVILVKLFLTKDNNTQADNYNLLQKIESNIQRIESSLRDEFSRNREENQRAFKENREELSQSFKLLSDASSKNITELSQSQKIQLELFSKQLQDLINLFDSRSKNLAESLDQAAKDNRKEQTESLKSFEDKFSRNVKDFNELQKQKFEDLAHRQETIKHDTETKLKEIRETVEEKLKLIREDNSKQLDEMRKTVDEKLQKTLNERLSQSFETVGKQLQAVQEGLGEMKNLASDVGGLKKVLSNVKMRGGIGEIQLSMLLEQLLAPEQYSANVKTKENSSELVEFAIKLPGKDNSGKAVWLPIDAKFPKDIYEQLQTAYDDGDPAKIQTAQKNLELTIKKMAKDISEKYIDPPNTTDFGIMFLPFEGIYAEVVRKAALLEELQRSYKIIVTGPTTLAAILNSLQMGFKTLAIEKRSSEVWQVLAAVKKEFSNFSGMMEKAQKNIQTGLNHLDEVMGKRTRAIQRSLKNVEALKENESKKLLELDSENSDPFEDEEI